MRDVLLSARFSIDYPGKPGTLRDIALEIRTGEIFGLIGPSGSGKSTIALALLGLLGFRGGTVRGQLLFQGRDLMACGERAWRSVRGREIALVLQSPIAALNPALRIETQLREAWRVHRAESWKQARPEIQAQLRSLELPADDGFLRHYPRQLSVGQAQRVLIAMAVMHRPKLLIADEPTSALDPVAQGQTLALFRRLNREMGTAILYISHDLASVSSICHTVAVLEAGRVAACGPAGAVLGTLQANRDSIEAVPVASFH
jgi:ABC-type glutathione transport system ATPase component